MKASELIARLAEHPDYEVLVWAPDGEGEVCLCPIANAGWDCFHPDGPAVFDIEIDRSNTTTDAISDWLDGEGELPPARRHGSDGVPKPDRQ